MFFDAFNLILLPITWGFDLFVQVLRSANALPVYLGLFLIFTVSRLFIRKWVGDSSSSTHKED